MHTETQPLADLPQVEMTIQLSLQEQLRFPGGMHTKTKEQKKKKSKLYMYKTSMGVTMCVEGGNLDNQWLVSCMVIKGWLFTF